MPPKRRKLTPKPDAPQVPNAKAPKLPAAVTHERARQVCTNMEHVGANTPNLPCSWAQFAQEVLVMRTYIDQQEKLQG